MNVPLAKTAVVVDVLLVLAPAAVFGWRWFPAALILLSIPSAVGAVNMWLAMRRPEQHRVTLLTLLCLVVPSFVIATVLLVGPGG